MENRKVMDGDGLEIVIIIIWHASHPFYIVNNYIKIQNLFIKTSNSSRFSIHIFSYYPFLIKNLFRFFQILFEKYFKFYSRSISNSILLFSFAPVRGPLAPGHFRAGLMGQWHRRWWEKYGKQNEDNDAYITSYSIFFFPLFYFWNHVY